MIDIPFKMVEQPYAIFDNSFAKSRGVLARIYLKSPDKKRLQGSVYCGYYNTHLKATTRKFSKALCIKISFS